MADASLSRGTQDLKLWNAARVRLWAQNEHWPADAEQPEYFTLQGAAWRTGISRSAAKRVLPQHADGWLLYGELRQPLYLDATCARVRRLIKSGEIYVRRDGLAKAKFAVRICSPRHTLNADIASESQWQRKQRWMIY
jgi:hypothetical protein